MISSVRIIAGAVALIAVTGCAGAKTDAPVVTKGADGTSVSPAGTEVAKRGKSMVRLVNALPNQPSIDVTSDQQQTFAAVQYKSVTPYREVGDNLVTFRLTGAGLADALADNNETLTDGYRYTIVALPKTEGGSQMRILRDEVVPDSGKTRIRVINAVPGLGELDVAVSGKKETLFSGINYGSEAGYQDMDPMTAVLEIRTEKGSRQIKVKNMKFDGGKAYTIVVIGTGSSKLDTIVFNDDLVGS